MVAGIPEMIESEEILVAEARYVPNAQFPSIPFRSELIHCVRGVSPMFSITNNECARNKANNE